MVFHRYCHTFNKQAHAGVSDIRSLVTTVPYGKIRYPMYLSSLMIGAGVAQVFGHWGGSAVAPLFSCLVWVVARFEEKRLTERFGEDYELYKKQVRFMSIPGIL